MAFFPHNLYNTETSFAPLFRLLDDFNSYSRQSRNGHHAGPSLWQPKFDVRETDEAYELHGELPGMSKEEVKVEFTEPQTILIYGKSERAYTSSTPSAGLVEDATMHGAITDGSEKRKTSHKSKVENGNSNQPVEEKSGDEAKYWLSERSIGEFSRSFNFPTRVDQDSVSASFKDGILSIVVPKVKKNEARAICIC